MYFIKFLRDNSNDIYLFIYWKSTL